MELNDLIGEHKLSGVDFDTIDDAQVMYFKLDGINYGIVEDPEDGYRSSMKELIVTFKPIKNIFTPIPVYARMLDSEDNYILNIYDKINTKLVIEAGTKDISDYYPSFVARFTPENMTIPKINISKSNYKRINLINI